MDFLEHYNAELRHLREAGARFARENPQVAARLGLHPDAVSDPFVERLLDGVSFLSARVHARLDRECAEFARQALSGLAPLFMRSTPAIACFAFHPDGASPEVHRGQMIPRGSALHASFGGRAGPVRFTTARDVTLWPLRLAGAECQRGLVDIPVGLAARLTGAQAVIRLRFQLEGSLTLADLRGQGPERPLQLSLVGDLPSALALQRALLADTREWFGVVRTDLADRVVALPRSGLRLSGTGDEESLLPGDLGAMPGLRLLREYFAQPHRFLGIDLHALDAMAAACPGGRSFDLVFGLARTPPDLLGAVGADRFRLFATPAINLYPRRLDPLSYDPDKTEQWLPVDRVRPNAHHLWALGEVRLGARDGRTRPAASVLDSGRFGMPTAARWSLRTEPAEFALGGRRERDDPLATHDSLSVTLAGDCTGLEEVSTVLSTGLVADRGWSPSSLLDARFHLAEARAVERVECLWPASAPRAMPDMQACWAAVRGLGADLLGGGRPGKRADITTRVDERLRLAARVDDPLDQQRLRSLRSVVLTPGFARAGRGLPMAWVRNVRLDIDIAAADHADHGAWLFGRILAQALAEASTLNDGLDVHLSLDGELASRHDNTVSGDGRLQ